jgi:hypothetical protein
MHPFFFHFPAKNFLFLNFRFGLLDWWENPLEYMTASCCGSIYLAEGVYSSGESFINSLMTCLFYPLSLFIVRNELREQNNIIEDDCTDDLYGVCCMIIFIILL